MDGESPDILDQPRAAFSSLFRCHRSPHAKERLWILQERSSGVLPETRIYPHNARYIVDMAGMYQFENAPLRQQLKVRVLISTVQNWTSYYVANSGVAWKGPVNPTHVQQVGCHRRVRIVEPTEV